MTHRSFFILRQPEGGRGRQRSAVAIATVDLGRDLVKRWQQNGCPKGDPYADAAYAASIAAKSTGLVLPRCHPRRIDSLGFTTDLDPDSGGVHLTVEVEGFGVVGIEMEALTAVLTAAAAIVDCARSETLKWSIRDVAIRSST